METGTLLPIFLPTSGPSRAMSSSKYHIHSPCHLCGFWMPDMGVLPGPLVLAYGRRHPSIVCKVQSPDLPGGAGWRPAT